MKLHKKYKHTCYNESCENFHTKEGGNCELLTMSRERRECGDFKSYADKAKPLPNVSSSVQTPESGISIPAKLSKANPLDVQVGGGHYKSMPIQPVEFCFKNNLNNCQSNIIKYVTRYKSKNGKQDLEKAKHYIDLLIQLEYGETK